MKSTTALLGLILAIFGGADWSKVRAQDQPKHISPVTTAKQPASPQQPQPTHADVAFGSHPHQLLDVYLPSTGDGPYPAIVWFGGIWKAAKHPVNLGYFLPRGIAVIAVQVRTMDDAVAANEQEPISYVQRDAIRAVQFVRHHAGRWKIDSRRLAVGGGSQGAQPALFVGCSRDQANSAATDPIERESSRVTCVAAYRCQPTFDPQRMQQWVPGVKWGAPALGCTFEESLTRREQLLPILRKWSPDYLLHPDAAPMFFENEWGLVRPADITQTNYDVHSPAWAIGFQKLAQAAGATCYVKYPGNPVAIADNIWAFVAQQLTGDTAVQASASASTAPWGAYRIVSASTPEFVLEAVDGVQASAVVSIQKPRDFAGQQWVLVPANGAVRVSPAHDPTLALAVQEGNKKNGATIMLEKDRGEPWQRWNIVKHANGSYSLIPLHASEQGLDHFGGRREVGAIVDLWSYRADDVHLQWFIRPLTGSGVGEQPTAAVSAYQPPAIAPDKILAGSTKQFRFTQSRIFPGTVRDVTVFIPAQYDGRQPACVYVKTDGFNPFEQKMLETMIATKEIPLTIGVFVRPGELPAPMPGTAGRRNRDFEYDGISDNKVRFLIDELLPFIAQEYQLKLSTDGNDRCISGGSSGGIAAFTAAWHRPDAFSRVYAASGSWVAFRGGHEFPTMVRKFEAKPIRAFLTTATRDMENVAGDWFLLDQEMDKALKFSGYDYQFRIVDGRHVQGYAEHWREAMAYLWKDWPQPVKAGPSAPRAQEVLIPGEDWQLVAEGFKSTRGPANNAAGEVFFADTSNNKLHRIGLDGRVQVFVDDAAQAHCVAVGADGAVFTVSEKTDKLMRYDSAGNGTVVMSGILGHSILARPDGGLYVTTNGSQPHGPGTVWHIKNGRKTQVDSGIKFATGMAYRPDQWLLAVAEGHSKWIYSYQVNDDGTLSNKERFFHLHVNDWDDDAGPESLCYSLEGRQFVATRSGIQISADDGPTQIILPVPGGGRVTGVAIGGPAHDTLFAFCMQKIWKRKIQQHGMGAFSPWTKVTPNKL